MLCVRACVREYVRACVRVCVTWYIIVNALSANPS